jgi:hypothetical protein
VKRSATLKALVPAGVVTVTSTVPAAAAELVALIELALLTVKVLAAVDPNLTPIEPMKLVPVIITDVPPPEEPDLGMTDVTVGDVLPELPRMVPVLPTATQADVDAQLTASR